MLDRIQAVQSLIDDAAVGVADILLAKGTEEEMEPRQVIAFALSPASADWHLRETLRRLQEAACLACAAYQIADEKKIADGQNDGHNTPA